MAPRQYIQRASRSTGCAETTTEGGPKGQLQDAIDQPFLCAAIQTVPIPHPAGEHGGRPLEVPDVVEPVSVLADAPKSKKFLLFDDAPVDEVMYRLYTIDKVCQGLNDIKEGKTISTEALLKEIDTW